MYVASTGDSRIVRLPLHEDGHPSTGETFVQMDHGYPDGMAFDAEGNLLVGANSHTDCVAGDIQVFDRTGQLVEILQVGPNRRYTNLAITGDGTIIISDSEGGGILAMDGWQAPGLALYPRRRHSATEPRLAAGLISGGSVP
jgi:gluconolactonase